MVALGAMDFFPPALVVQGINSVRCVCLYVIQHFDLNAEAYSFTLSTDSILTNIS